MYIITSGSYSDYTVHGYCTTEEKAKKYCALANVENKWASYEYEKVDCLDDEANTVVDMYYSFTFCFVRHGVKNEWSLNRKWSGNIIAKKITKCEYVPTRLFGKNGLVQVTVTSEKNDEDLMLKVAQDELYKWLAEQEKLC